MSLKRKFLWRNGAILLGLALVGAVASWGLGALRHQVDRIVIGAYDDMDSIQRSLALITNARTELTAADPSVTAAMAKLNQAAQYVTTFIEHEAKNYRMDSAQALLAQIDGARSLLNAVKPDPAAAARALDGTDRHVTAAVNFCQTFIERQQRAAASQMWNTTLIMFVIIAVTIIASLIITTLQYRDVMLPLERLRQGVRRVAGSEFTGTIEENGSKEFAELAVEFNHMARELDSFYRKLEEKVVAKSRELVRSERLASVGFLAAGVSHEINNPLNIISGYAELSLKRLTSNANASAVNDAIQGLQVIRDEAFRCKEITNKLLSLAKGDSGSRSTLALDSVAREVAVLAGGLRDFRDRRIELKLDGPLNVMANPTEMKQVLLNLTVNALQSVKPGEGKVLIEGKRRNGWVEVSVCDNGYGMAADSIKQVFEPFYTRRPGTRAPGTGLGLSITHAIVESHGGHIRAESDGTGMGSRFTVELPAVVREGA